MSRNRIPSFPYLSLLDLFEYIKDELDLRMNAKEEQQGTFFLDLRFLYPVVLVTQRNSSDKDKIK